MATLNEKLNKTLPYQTERMIVIEHWPTSLLYRTFYILIIVYTVVFVFLILKKEFKQDLDVGYTYYSIEGKTYAMDSSNNTVAWDIGDSVFPEREATGPFVGARAFRIVGQTLGYCGPKCSTNQDCEDDPPLMNQVCETSGLCRYYRWCPDIEYADSSEIETINIQGIQNLTVSLYSAIKFPIFSTTHYTSNEKNSPVYYPNSKANTYLIGDFMSEGGVSMKDLTKTGVTIKVYFSWNCDVSSSDCTPTIEYTRVDADDVTAPVTMDRSFHYYVNGVETRDFYRYVGLKLYFYSKGNGLQFSFNDMMLQIASAVALLKLLPVIVDVIISTCYVEEKRKKFVKAKLSNSEDFTNKRERIDYINYLRKKRYNQSKP